jgi:DNA-binding MarR family transcriptional regulator
MMNDDSARATSDLPAIAFWRNIGIDDEQKVELVVSILRAHQLINGTIERALRPFDLGLTRFLALVSVMYADGGMRLSDLSTNILVHPTTVTVVVDQLVKQGLMRREPHPVDRRSTLAVITPSGRTVAEQASLALSEQNFGLPVLTRTKVSRLIFLLAELRAASADGWPVV